MFLFSMAYSSALWLIQPLVQWATFSYHLGGKAAGMWSWPFTNVYCRRSVRRGCKPPCIPVTYFYSIIIKYKDKFGKTDRPNSVSDRNVIPANIREGLLWVPRVLMLEVRCNTKCKRTRTKFCNKSLFITLSISRWTVVWTVDKSLIKPSVDKRVIQ